MPAGVARSVEGLGDGAGLDFVFFWGHQPRSDGTVGPSCLSQWWPSPFSVDGIAYGTAEHWMMAAKARLFGDAEVEERVLAAGTPKQAKALGREVKPFDSERWEGERFDLVVRGNVAKFEQNPHLWRYLDGTGDAVLVEASPVDRIWGIGLAEDDARARRPREWDGLNLLGFALMEVRARLRGS